LLTFGNGFLQTLVRDLHQFAALFVHFTHEESLVQITVIAVLVESDIQIHYAHDVDTSVFVSGQANKSKFGEQYDSQENTNQYHPPEGGVCLECRDILPR
jgi:hypothetical protein